MKGKKNRGDLDILFTMRLEPSLREAINNEAKRQGVSAACVVRQVLRTALHNEEYEQCIEGLLSLQQALATAASSMQKLVR